MNTRGDRERLKADLRLKEQDRQKAWADLQAAARQLAELVGRVRLESAQVASIVHELSGEIPASMNPLEVDSHVGAALAATLQAVPGPLVLAGGSLARAERDWRAYQERAWTVHLSPLLTHDGKG